jgi:aryl-alcohol dehydrogenase-like predicted oxidoreductase
MTFGTEWGWGCDYKTSKDIFESFVKKGGNFLDTANRYTEGTSEKFLGEFIHSSRDQFVLATKYTLFDKQDDVSFSGNSRKNLFRSVEESLRRLNTEYIDLLWLHAWDFMSPIEEVMRSLDDLVRSGKVHYIGVSDAPAWIVSRANTLAELRGWTSFIGLQIEYSLIERTPERDLLPMARAMDISVTPWAPLGGGVLTGKYLRGEKGRIEKDHPRLNDINISIAGEVVRIAEELGTTPAQVAMNWVRQKGPQMIPIVGATSAEQLENSMGCLSFTLPDEQMEALDEVTKIDLGFPHEFLRSEMVKHLVSGGTWDLIEKRPDRT